MLKDAPRAAETQLWRALRNKSLGVKFRRQEVIGPYIVHLVCYEKRLVIELEDANLQEDQEKPTRDAWLNAQGFNVIRFKDHDVLGNVDAAYQEIRLRLKDARPLPKL
ncbi:MAG: DUF559 domain-containing protein [Candidatus Omnitrophica bacterium]|nr:DUF559 domain-containing protein [Candidatus Omnitrophota bacterium]